MALNITDSCWGKRMLAALQELLLQSVIVLLGTFVFPFPVVRAEIMTGFGSKVSFAVIAIM
jgi:hypothetical protein